MEELSDASRWFRQSGIQDPCGGVARYYRWDTGRAAPVSTEITGYAVRALLGFGGGEWREAALRAGRFLTRVAWSDRSTAMPSEPSANGAAPRSYFFDCGIIARGLLALWRETREPEFLATASACAESMALDFAAPGWFHAVLDARSKQPLDDGPRWSRRPGCYQLKAALAWLELDEAIGRCHWREQYDKALCFALRDHSSFLGYEPDSRRVVDRLHAYCYFLEGLLPAACRDDAAPVLTEGIASVAAAARELAPIFERSDVWAQLLRLRLYGDALAVVPLDESAAAEEACRMQRFRVSSADPRIDGCFAFGRRGDDLLPFANPVSTAFCVQALANWCAYQAGKFVPDWRTLI